MRIAIGMDIHDAKCAVHAVYAGNGRVKKHEQELLDVFNHDFRRVKTDRNEFKKMLDTLEGHTVSVLIENSTIVHKVYWALKNIGVEVTVAQSADLKNITDSVTKNDDNDAKELAAYERRRIHGEKEFAICIIAPPEIMAKKQFIRAIFADKVDLADTKKRVRARVKVMGKDLKKDYSDISCKAAMNELKHTKDPFLMYEVAVMRSIKDRISEGEKHVTIMFSDDRNTQLLMTIPGFGIVFSAYVSMIIMDIDRFDSNVKLEAFSGLVPKQNASSNSDPDCRTTHHGDRIMREHMKYAVIAHVKWAPNSIVTQMYHRLRKRGVKYNKVITACSRKMMDVIRSVLKNQRPFTTDAALLRLARGTASELEKDHDDDAEYDDESSLEAMETNILEGATAKI